MVTNKSRDVLMHPSVHGDPQARASGVLAQIIQLFAAAAAARPNPSRRLEPCVGRPAGQREPQKGVVDPMRAEGSKQRKPSAQCALPLVLRELGACPREATGDSASGRRCVWTTLGWVRPTWAESDLGSMRPCVRSLRQGTAGGGPTLAWAGFDKAVPKLTKSALGSTGIAGVSAQMGPSSTPRPQVHVARRILLHNAAQLPVRDTGRSHF